MPRPWQDLVVGHEAGKRRYLRTVGALLVVAGAIVVAGLVLNNKGSHDERASTSSTSASTTTTTGLDLEGPRCQVRVFMDPRVSDADREVLEATIQALPQVGTNAYVDEAESLAEFERLFADDEDMLERMRENPERMPTSFRVVPATDDHAAIETTTDELSMLPGVLRATSGVEVLDSVQRALDTLGGC